MAKQYGIALEYSTTKENLRKNDGDGCTNAPHMVPGMALTVLISPCEPSVPDPEIFTLVRSVILDFNKIEISTCQKFCGVFDTIVRIWIRNPEPDLQFRIADLDPEGQLIPDQEHL